MINFAHKAYINLHTHTHTAYTHCCSHKHAPPLAATHTHTQTHSRMVSSEQQQTWTSITTSPARPGGVFKQQLDPQLILPDIPLSQHTTSPPVTPTLSLFLSVSPFHPWGKLRWLHSHAIKCSHAVWPSTFHCMYVCMCMCVLRRWDGRPCADR